MYDHSFYPIINIPTGICPTSNTCIDHIWTNVHDKIIKSSIITHMIADHLQIIQSTQISNDIRVLDPILKQLGISLKETNLYSLKL